MSGVRSVTSACRILYPKVSRAQSFMPRRRWCPSLSAAPTVLGHDRAQGLLDVQGDLLLVFEGLVEVQLGDLGAHDVEDVRADLLLRRGQAVVGVVHLLADDLVLHTDHHRHEHVVFRLGLTGHILTSRVRPARPAARQRDGVSMANLPAAARAY
eukprot:scaffold1340_cov253-Pinguiococcus_pyrenoidosus.AAC.24